MKEYHLKLVCIALCVCSCVLIWGGLTLENFNRSVIRKGSSRLLGQRPSIDSGSSLQRRRRDGKGNANLRYRWLDPHSIRYMSWQGDIATVDRSREQHLTLDVTVDLRRMRQAIESFGVPTAWNRISYRTQVEFDRKKRKIKRKAAARGVIICDWTMSLDYAWMIRQSVTDVKSLTRKLYRLAQQKGYRSQRHFVSLLASFAQAMEYKIPPATTTTESYGQVETVGATMPIETLYKGWGDCDTKSVLFAAMMANIPRQTVVFLIGNAGNDHLFVGFRGVPRRGDHFISLQGTKYVLIEMTSLWPIGRISQESWRGRNLFNPVKVVTTAHS